MSVFYKAIQVDRKHGQKEIAELAAQVTALLGEPLHLRTGLSAELVEGLELEVVFDSRSSMHNQLWFAYPDQKSGADTTREKEEKEKERGKSNGKKVEKRARRAKEKPE